MEKQLQQQLQQMTNLQKQHQQAPNPQTSKEVEQLKNELQATNVERERFQGQLEMLVQELEKSQVSFSFCIMFLSIFYNVNYLVVGLIGCKQKITTSWPTATE
jgi:hypothetical protein